MGVAVMNVDTAVILAIILPLVTRLSGRKGNRLQPGQLFHTSFVMKATSGRRNGEAVQNGRLVPGD